MLWGAGTVALVGVEVLLNQFGGDRGQDTFVLGVMTFTCLELFFDDLLVHSADFCGLARRWRVFLLVRMLVKEVCVKRTAG